MLVLSRGLKEEILFPKLGITVKIVRISGNRVRLGIEAPEEIGVIRAELAESQFDDVPAPAAKDKESDHRLRNRLNSARLALQLAAEQLDRGMEESALSTLSRSLREFDTIESELEHTVDETEQTPLPKALVVEDDANERELLAGLLSLNGFEVDTAGDGLGALLKLSRHELPNVVLLDMMMPKLNGRQTLDRIRGAEELRNLRVIAVSGMEPEDMGVEIGPNGVDCWIRKPVKASELVAEMRRELAISP